MDRMAALYKLCGTVNASSSGLKKLGESNLCMNQVDQMEPKNDGKFHSYDSQNRGLLWLPRNIVIDIKRRASYVSVWVIWVGVSLNSIWRVDCCKVSFQEVFTNDTSSSVHGRGMTWGTWLLPTPAHVMPPRKLQVKLTTLCWNSSVFFWRIYLKLLKSTKVSFTTLSSKKKKQNMICELKWRVKFIL